MMATKAKKKQPAQRKGKTPHAWISWTQCETYHACPKMYESKYVKGSKPERNYPMKLGSAMHLAARALNLKAKQGAELAPDDVKAVFEGAVRTELGKAEITPLDYRMGLEGLTLYAQRLDREIDRMHGAEVEVDIPYRDGVALRVIIDRLDYLEGDGMKVLDYKNGWKILSKGELAEDRQLAIYAYAATQIVPGLKRIVIAQHMFRHAFENALEIDPDHVNYIKAWIDEALDGIVSKEYPARINRNCHQCRVRGTCAEYKRRFLSGAKGDETIKDAQKAHDRLKRVEASLTLLKNEQKDLRGYLSEIADAGMVPVDGGAKVWRFKEEEVRSFPTTSFVKLFTAAGTDITPHLKLDSRTYETLKAQLFRDGGLSEKAIQKFKENAAKLTKTEKRTKLSLTLPPKEDEKD
jgi:RecB family exonuclease